MVWIVPVGSSAHLAGLFVDPLAGHGESFTWRVSVPIELDATVFVRFDGEGQRVDVVAEFGGDFEYPAIVLEVCFVWRVRRVSLSWVIGRVICGVQFR